MKTRKNFWVEVYNFWFIVVVVDELSEYCDDVTEHTLGRTFKGEDARYAEVIVTPNTPPGAIAHECGHAKNILFRRIGHVPDLENDEPEQYLLGYMVDQVYKVLDRHEKQRLKNSNTIKSLTEEAAKKLCSQLDELHETTIKYIEEATIR